MARKLSRQPATTRWLGEPEPEPHIILLLAIIERARLDAYGGSKAVDQYERQAATAFLAELKGENCEPCL